MYEYIRGKLAGITPSSAILDVGGVGYKVLIPTSAFSDLQGVRGEVTLFVSLITRDTGSYLCGFLNIEERDLFITITNISGIGPKTALSMIGHMSLQDLHLAVANHDIKSISRIPGIGKKTAERFIVEMRDKSFGLLPTSFQLKGNPKQQAIGDAMRALINLGYNQVAAQKALKLASEELPDNPDLSALLTHSLRHAST